MFLDRDPYSLDWLMMGIDSVDQELDDGQVEVEVRIGEMVEEDLLWILDDPHEQV